MTHDNNQLTIPTKVGTQKTKLPIPSKDGIQE